MSFFKTIKNTLGLENEMPKYEILKTLANDVEIRKYAASKWVCAKMDDVKMKEREADSDSSTMFRKLFKYITGTNSDSQKIAMTVPVTMDYSSKDNKEIVKDSTCVMSMGFFVPEEFNKSTPKPTGDNMFIRELPEMTVAASRFSGYATLDDFMKHRDIIISALGPEEAKNYDLINLKTAVYNAPFNPFFRRNECWLVKQQN